MHNKRRLGAAIEIRINMGNRVHAFSNVSESGETLITLNPE
jgi:hypothetical protein